MEKPSKIIATMTSIPSRIDLIRPVVESVLAQSIKVDCLELNIPFHSIRFSEDYVIPGWLVEYENISVYRTEDYGPITQIAPTLIRYRDDPGVHIWSIDDDCVYPRNQLELLCNAFDPTKPRILARYGGRLNDDGTVAHWYGKGEVNYIEGYGGVLYPPGCIATDFDAYVDFTSNNEHCRIGDDIVLSMYFRRHPIPMYLYNVPSVETSYNLLGWLPHSRRHALSAAGHFQTTFKGIFDFINSAWPTLSAKDSKEELANSSPLAGGPLLQETLRETLSLLEPRCVVGYSKIRVGNRRGDGGYVMVDDLKGIVEAISAGIGGDASWDEEIASYGIEIYQYDHTVDCPPIRNKHFHFFKRKVCATPSANSESLSSMVERATSKEALLLKIDIEGSEWEVLEATSKETLQRFKQIVIELHHLSKLRNHHWRQTAIQVLKKLHDIFQVVHIHANNWGGFEIIANMPVPDVVEITYVNRKAYKFVELSRIVSNPT